jgi:outer membrane receptor protein involved in Fe transport
LLWAAPTSHLLAVTFDPRRVFSDWKYAGKSVFGGTVSLLENADVVAPSHAVASIRSSSSETPQHFHPMKPGALRFLMMALISWQTAGFLHAQTTNNSSPAAEKTPPDVVQFKPEVNEEVTVLSPFVVTSENDKGYAATSTLAGSRLRSDLRDLASSISVITPEFMKDTGSTNMSDLLIYTMGTEVTGHGGNFQNDTAQGQGKLAGIDNLMRNYAPQTRARGLATLDLTRDFFETGIPFDSYNTDRVEVNRGANAALFGLGSPAGIINYSTNLAAQKNSAEVSVSVDDFGSTRGSLNVNRSLMNGRLSIRLASLDENSKFEQKPAFENVLRHYLAVNFKLFKNTSIRANYEKVEVDANRPRQTPPNDAITPWFTNGKPGVSYPLNNALNDFSLVTSAQQAEGQPTLIYLEANSPTLGTQTALGRVDSLLLFAGSSLSFASSQNIKDAQLSNSGVLSNPINGRFALVQTILDRSVFDYRKKLLDGPNKFEWNDFEVYSVALEQLAFDGAAGVEMVVQNEDQYLGTFNPFRNLRTDLRIDVNQTNLDGTPNVNFGRPYIHYDGQAFSAETARRNYRATGFITYDFAEKRDNWMTRLIGKHTLTGAYLNRAITATTLSSTLPYFVGPDWANNALSYNPNLGTRSISTIQYLGPSLLTKNSLAGADIPAITAYHDPAVFTNSPISVYQPTVLNSNAAPYKVSTVTALSLVPGSTKNKFVGSPFAPGKSKQTVGSVVANLQSGWLGGNLVTLLSWRQDTFRNYPNLNPRPVVPAGQELEGGFISDPKLLLLDSNPNLTSKTRTKTWSAVGHTPRGILQKVPHVSDFSVFYNKSENVRPVADRIDIYAQPIALPSGNTKEYGFILGLFENKFNLRATWYKTDQALDTQNVSTTVFNLGAIHTAFRASLATMVQDINSPTTSAGDRAIRQRELQIAQQSYTRPTDVILTQSFNLTPETFNGVNTVVAASTSARSTDVTNVKSKGMEVEGTYSPSPNWRIAFNVAKQEAVRSGTAATLTKYIAEQAAMWSGPAGDIYVNVIGGQTYRQRFAEQIQTPNDTLVLGDGRPAQELRKWRTNLITDYSFERGTKLAGWNIGGGVRWEDKSAIGFPYLFDAKINNYRIDISKPYYAPSQTYADGHIGYTMPIYKKKATLVVQLNVRNLMDNDDDVPIGVQPDGKVAQIRIQNGRTYQLTGTVKF